MLSHKIHLHLLPDRTLGRAGTGRREPTTDAGRGGVGGVGGSPGFCGPDLGFPSGAAAPARPPPSRQGGSPGFCGPDLGFLSGATAADLEPEPFTGPLLCIIYYYILLYIIIIIIIIIIYIYIYYVWYII